MRCCFVLAWLSWCWEFCWPCVFTLGPAHCLEFRAGCCRFCFYVLIQTSSPTAAWLRRISRSRCLFRARSIFFGESVGGLKSLASFCFCCFLPPLLSQNFPRPR